MKPKTQELLYFLLWSFDRLARPTWRNMTDSFEAWAYRNGFQRQLAELERRQFLESQPTTTDCSAPSDRVFRLTEAGRLCALGGRDPEACWKRSWDGRWRPVLFDLPMAQSAQRDRLRRYLRDRGFGYLQHSVWVSPNPMAEAKALLSGATANVGSLILLEARPCAGRPTKKSSRPPGISLRSTAFTQTIRRS